MRRALSPFRDSYERGLANVRCPDLAFENSSQRRLRVADSMIQNQGHSNALIYRCFLNNRGRPPSHSRFSTCSLSKCRNHEIAYIAIPAER
jgi:hypothetical protein